MLAAGRQLDAIELVREVLLDEPEDEDAQEVYGRALEELHRRAGAGEKLGRAERAELAIGSRTARACTRCGMRCGCSSRSAGRSCGCWLPASVRDWMEQLHAGRGQRVRRIDFGPETGDDEERSEALLRFAIEHAWLMEADPDEDEGERFRARARAGARAVGRAAGAARDRPGRLPGDLERGGASG